MSVNQELDYYSVDDALARAQTSMDPSDCHGLLAGLICAAGFADPLVWMAEVFEDYNPKDKPQQQQQIHSLWQLQQEPMLEI